MCKEVYGVYEGVLSQIATSPRRRGILPRPLEFENSMPSTYRFMLLTDLHLSDDPHTATAHALRWAVEQVNQQKPDFLAIGGDVTTFGTAASTAQFLAAIERVEVPVLLTLGNAELRSPDAVRLLKDRLAPEQRYRVQNDLLVLLPNIPLGTLSIEEREWLNRIALQYTEINRRIVITHVPVDRMEAETDAWFSEWIRQQRVELLVVGHIHEHRARCINGCLEIATRGLDPDKAIGDFPGISLFESSGQGQWSEQFYPWSPAIELLPADLPNGISPVGWSIHGDPVDAARETLEFGLSCLELRPRDFNFSRRALVDALRALRDTGPFFLSYQLPGLGWNQESRQIVGESALSRHLECALESGVNSLTVPVPQAFASELESVGTEGVTVSPLYQAFLQTYTRILQEPARTGVRIAIQNTHNAPKTPVDAPHRKFATKIDEYIRWIDAVAENMADIPGAMVGALLDVGYARNNGGDLDNLQPLCDWYARLGRRILGYHIYQVDNDPGTGALKTHIEISQFFGRRISYAGLLWAWSTHQITRGPLFVAVQDDVGRRNTVRRFKQLFADAERIRDAIDLPGRPAPINTI